MAGVKGKEIRQSISFEADPKTVYDALMDSKKHTEFTGSKAVVSRKVGGKFTAYGGGINGKNLKLVPGSLIVQEWYCQTNGWPEGVYSKATFTLKRTRTGTRLDFVQTGVPEPAVKDIGQGWKDYYWQPMKAYFSRTRRLEYP